MTISKRVQQELQLVLPEAGVPEGLPDDVAQHSTREARMRRETLALLSKGQAWTASEHTRFLEGLDRYPSGPWQAIAEHVGTKNARQTMTHAQKCRQKRERRARGLRRNQIQNTKPSTSGSGAGSPSGAGTPSGASPASPLIKTESSLDSPRSGEDECGGDQLLLDEDAMVREIFAQFPAPPSLQSEWSTSSFPDAPVDLSELDELSLSALPDEFPLQWAV